jgi:hypothetical protein
LKDDDDDDGGGGGGDDDDDDDDDDREMGWEGVYWIHLTEDRDECNSGIIMLGA